MRRSRESWPHGLQADLVSGLPPPLPTFACATFYPSFHATADSAQKRSPIASSQRPTSCRTFPRLAELSLSIASQQYVKSLSDLTGLFTASIRNESSSRLPEYGMQLEAPPNYEGHENTLKKSRSLSPLKNLLPSE